TQNQNTKLNCQLFFRTRQVLGVDNDEMVAAHCAVPLSSIRLNSDQVAFAACERLEKMLTEGESSMKVKLIPPVDVMERRSTGGAITSHPVIRKALSYIDEHLETLPDISALARAVGTNRRMLERLFRHEMGLSPAQWIVRQRCQHAVDLFRHTDYTVEHVAALAGFGDRRRLYRALKNNNLPLPSRIRKKSG
ncbi:MAG: helix-turn-helix domain-containing protein, partial [Opitutales bacterium]|nr:helix-turn-helix domain-containing protein [Opitutales bacterium]